MEKKNQSTIRRLDEFNSSYTLSIKENDNGRRYNIDILDGLIIYGNSVQTLMSVLYNYGKQMLEFKDIAIELNYQNNLCLKEALIDFSRSVGDFLGC